MAISENISYFLNASQFNPDQENSSSTSSTQSQLSHEFNLIFKFRVALSWISLIVIIIGLIGNAISLIVLVSPKMRIATNVFLASLCISDFFALLGLLINSVIYELITYYYHMFDEVWFRLIQFFYPYIYPLITTFQFSCIMLTVCVSVNQFVCIYSAKLKSHSKNSQREECRTALKIVIVVYMISIAYCIPYWLKFKYTSEGLQETEYGRDPLFNKLVHFWLYLPIAYIIPFSILIVTNTYLIGTLMLARKRRARLNMSGANGPSNNQKRASAGSTFSGGRMSKKNKKYSKKLEEFEHQSLAAAKEPKEVTAQEEDKSSWQQVSKKKRLNFPKIDIKMTRLKSSSDEQTESNLMIRTENELNTNNGNKTTATADAPSRHGKLQRGQSDEAKTPNTMRRSFKNKPGSISITIMLIAVVFLFFLCQFPNLILHIIQSMYCNQLGCRTWAFYHYGMIISKFLLICNLSFNFACYCVFNEKFREVFYEKFCCSQDRSLTFKIIFQ